MDFSLYLTNRRRFYKVLSDRYIWQLDVLNDFDSNIKFSEMGLSDKEEIDSDDDTVLADIAKWSDPLRSIQIAEFTGPTTVMENNKREIYFFNIFEFLWIGWVPIFVGVASMCFRAYLFV
jgi:hypothetical protein